MLEYSALGNKIPLKMVPSFGLLISEGESLYSLQHFAYVLDCISMLFRGHNPQIGEKPLTIVNYPHPDFPMCCRDKRVIYLNTSPNLWCQIAFQFAHELCHYAIPEEVSRNLRWFEESICEVASLYFLRQIGYYWMDIGADFKTSDGVPYAASFLRYAEDRLENVTPFDLRDTSVIRELELDCYSRKRNTYVAKLLLPIFVQHPELWTAVPLLCRIHEPNLRQSIDAWIHESDPSVWPALLQIRNLF